MVPYRTICIVRYDMVGTYCTIPTFSWRIIIFLPGLHTEFLTRKSARETNPDIEMARAVAGMAGHVHIVLDIDI